MTIPEIIKAVASVVGSYSEASFRRDARRLNIKPLGSYRSVPRQYPGNAPGLIVQSRGFETALLPMLPLAPTDTAAGRLVSLPKLKRIARTARKARAAR